MRDYPWILRAGLGLVLGGLVGFLGLLITNMGLGGVVAEELLKLVAIILVKMILGRVRASEGIMIGLSFGITETILYLLPMWSSGGSEVIERVLVTVPMHAATAGIIAANRWGIIVAIVLHGAFNYFVR